MREFFFFGVTLDSFDMSCQYLERLYKHVVVLCCRPLL